MLLKLAEGERDSGKEEKMKFFRGIGWIVAIIIIVILCYVIVAYRWHQIGYKEGQISILYKYSYYDVGETGFKKIMPDNSIQFGYISSINGDTVVCGYIVTKMQWENRE